MRHPSQHEDIPPVNDTTKLRFGANDNAWINATRDGDPFVIDFTDVNGVPLFSFTMDITVGEYTLVPVTGNVTVAR